MKKDSILKILFFLLIFVININFCYADDYIGTITATGVYLRKGAGTNYSVIKTLSQGNKYKLVSNNIVPNQAGCNDGWYVIYYEGLNTGYVCSTYVSVNESSVEEVIHIDEDAYYRPWTTPKLAIMGGAKYITAAYINKGQFTSYLKKFNVNPASGRVYNHQYMANLAAPYSEAYSSFKSYRDNGLLELPLEFTIPIFENMPDNTKLPGKEANTSCQNEVVDEEFEEALNREEFPESYKCKLRLVHNTYANWTFKSLKTGLDFNKSVTAEKSVSSISGNEIYYDKSSGKYIQTEKGWYKANDETVAYYLDPRNFLNPERILMFENLGYSDNYTESVVQSIINNTFMEGYSLIDNMLYSSIFVEAGKSANISSVYLASLARQESGTKGSRATTGDEFTYQGVSYKNLFNFFNIGAYSSAESPILAGLVWASGGSSSVIVSNTSSGVSNNENPSDNEDNMQDNTESETPLVEVKKSILTEELVLEKLELTKQNDCLTNISIGTKVIDIKNKMNDVTIMVNGLSDEDIIKTGDVITITDNINTLSYTVSIKGDVDGDGKISSNDYVKIKNYIMEISGSELDVSRSVAADIDNNGAIGSADYVKIKNIIMER